MKPKTLVASLVLGMLMLSLVPSASAVVLMTITHTGGGAAGGEECQPGEPDTDQDGVCDRRDGDNDNDAVPDDCDPHPNDTSDAGRWADWATYVVRGCP